MLAGGTYSAMSYANGRGARNKSILSEKSVGGDTRRGGNSETLSPRSLKRKEDGLETGDLSEFAGK
jgi:hypothetical protein